jgi:prevent-host-death family protein
MVRMGVRELKDNLSHELRQAAAGQIIEVTEYGHRVARILPIHRQSGERLGSEILAELRADER